MSQQPPRMKWVTETGPPTQPSGRSWAGFFHAVPFPPLSFGTKRLQGALYSVPCGRRVKTHPDVRRWDAAAHFQPLRTGLGRKKGGSGAPGLFPCKINS